MLQWFAKLTLRRFLALSALWVLAVWAFLLGAVYLWIIPQFRREQVAGLNFYSMSFDPVRLTVLLVGPPLTVLLLRVFARRFAAGPARDDLPNT